MKYSILNTTTKATLILVLVLIVSCRTKRDGDNDSSRAQLISFSKLSKEERLLVVKRIIQAQINSDHFLYESERYTDFDRKFYSKNSLKHYFDTSSVFVNEDKNFEGVINKTRFYYGYTRLLHPDNYRLAITDSGRVYLLTYFYKNDWNKLLKNEIKKINNKREALKIFNIYKYLFHRYYRDVDSNSISGVRWLFPKLNIKLMSQPIFNGNFYSMQFYEWTDHEMTDSLDKAFVWEYKMKIDKNANFEVKKKTLGEGYVPY